VLYVLQKNAMSQEKQLQKDYGSVKRAEKFYNNQQIDHLNDMMIQFISNQEIMFIATSDNEGNCDNSIRAGKKGFISVINEKTLLYPEYRGNGVYASLGNIVENPHIGIPGIRKAISRK
jgi:predicted pyridoxine 5'-phosphate oxidase superfamily flavin-nucleotide-binding protein